MRTNLIRMLLLAGSSVLFAFQAVHAQSTNYQDEIGYAEFRLHCAACHGVDGSGTGSIAGLLNVTAEKLDLTDLKKNNNGEYPFRLVFEVIDGRQNVAAHGERLMPVWGDRYSIDAGDKYGPYGSESVINGRILELVYFIQSVQK